MGATWGVGEILGPSGLRDRGATKFFYLQNSRPQKLMARSQRPSRLESGRPSGRLATDLSGRPCSSKTGLSGSSGAVSSSASPWAAS